jgi:hypothetical protein
MKLDSDCLTSVFMYLDLKTCLAFKNHINLDYIVKVSNFDINEEAKNGNLKEVKYLVSKGQKTNFIGDSNATKNGHLEILKLVYSKCGSLRFSVNTLAEIAVRKGKLEIMKFLISTPEYRNRVMIEKNLDKLIQIACTYDRLQIVKYLVKNEKRDPLEALSFTKKYVGSSNTRVEKYLEKIFIIEYLKFY